MNNSEALLAMGINFMADPNKKDDGCALFNMACKLNNSMACDFYNKCKK